MIIASLPSFDWFSLGYVIAHLATGIPWSVEVSNTESFMYGLMTNQPCVGKIRDLKISHGKVMWEVFQYFPLHCVTSLDLQHCKLESADMIHLSELILDMTHLSALTIATCVDHDCFLKFLVQLSHSSVTTLNLEITDFKTESNTSTHEDYCSALKCLTRGKIQELYLDLQCDHHTKKRLASALPLPSTLKTLHLKCILTQHCYTGFFVVAVV